MSISLKNEAQEKQSHKLKGRMITVENFKLSHHSASATQENKSTFLTQHLIVYIASGTLRLVNNDSVLSVEEGEMCLISPGSYVSSEFTNNNVFSRFTLFFNQWTAQCILKLPGITDALNEQCQPTARQGVHILPKKNIFKLFFDSIRLYHKLEKKVKDEMLPIKFAELIYILLDSPHKPAILSFLSEAAMHSAK